MENLYKELRSFFANDIDLNDLYDSEAINLESNMFNLDMDEVSALLELRENNR